MLSLLIDSFENRDVAIADITGAYLFANMKDNEIIKIKNDAVDIMCKVDEGHKKYITYEKGIKVIYMALDKALYSCVQSALLWYNTFKSKLEHMRFEKNPCDPWIVNKKINNKQCTIFWYVVDIKILHQDYSIVSKVIEEIESNFGKMKVVRGN